MTLAIRCLLIAFLAIVTPLACRAADPPATSASETPSADKSLSPADAQRALEVLQDPQKRAALIDTLQTIAKAAPGTPAAGSNAAPVPAKAATPAGSAPTSAKAPASLAPGSIGAQLLGGVSGWLRDLGHDVAAAARTATDIPLLLGWLKRLAADPAARLAVVDAAWRIAAVLIGAFLAEWLSRRVLRRPLGALDAALVSRRPMIAPVDAAVPPPRTTTTRHGLAALRRLPAALARLVLDLLPVAIFAAAGFLLLGSGLVLADTPRLIILAVAEAYILFATIMAATVFLVSPDHGERRLVPMDDHLAAYVELWVRRISTIAIAGVTLADVAMILGLGLPAHDALVKLVALVGHICLVIVVLQNRQRIADLIEAPAGAHGPVATMRNRLAETWHDVAIFVILALWLAWALAVRESLTHLMTFILLTIAVLIGASLVTMAVLGLLDRVFHVPPELAKRYPGLETRANRYYPLLRRTVSAVIVLIAAVVMLQVWGVDAIGWFGAGTIGARLLAAAVTIAIAVALAILVWEFTDAAIDRHLTRLTAQSAVARAARIRTLLPMLRTTLMIVIVLVLGLTILSQIGVNVGPLLAGAGIVGIAIGFGSQKLVQDVITGLFLLLENAMQVGDWVTVSGLSGSVEQLSIRTIRLRAGDGSVHIIPFSSVTSVTNTNRGLGNAAVSVEVPAHEDTDRVGAMLSEIAAGMRQEPAFQAAMLSDLQLWGVDKVDGFAATIVGQIVCTDAGRWPVQREFNRRLKLRAKELGIELANPRRNFVTREPAEEEARPRDAAQETQQDAPPRGRSTPALRHG
jgi:small-conductance mechanosensitive channel